MTCSPADSISWTPGYELVCLACDTRHAPDFAFRGCASCGQGLLVGSYAPFECGHDTDLSTRAMALREKRLPIARTSLTDLGQQPTPLLEIETAGHNLLLKLESHNPTGSHKDRLHALSSALARQAGFTGVVSSSTGNHGLACAAYAARAGLGSVVVADPRMPAALRRQIRGHGAEIVEDRDARSVISELTDSGWFPATSLDPMLSGRSNPFGADAYRSIAYEIVADLGGAPATVAIPVASGDTFYGIWAGFDDICRTLDLPMPKIIACQPEAVAPLAHLPEGLSQPATSPERGQTMAVSAGDRQTGRQAAHALRRAGELATISEAEIRRWIQLLARSGVGVEPSSALAAAGIARQAESGPAVAIITSSWANWTEGLDEILDGKEKGKEG